MRLLVWLLRALVFFTLFAFALNNQHIVTVNWFFGAHWQAPMVMVVLAAFAAGCALGLLALAPRRWRNRRTPSISEAPQMPAQGGSRAPSAASSSAPSP